MARRLPLDRIEIERVADHQKFVLDYGETMQQILKSVPIGGLTIDDIERAVPVADTIAKAAAAGAAEVMLSDEDWHVLIDRLASFRWAIADQEILVFVRTVREAAEVGIGPLAAAAE